MTDNINMNARSEQAQPSRVDLSQQVFSDPTAYLQTLKADFAKIDTTNTGQLTKDVLQNYAIFGTDPEAVAATKETLQHLDELKSFRDHLPKYSIDDRWSDGLTKADIELVDDVMKGKPDAYIEHLKSGLKSDLTWDTVMGIGWGALTVMEIGLGNFYFAGGTGAMAIVHGMDAMKEKQGIADAQQNITGAFTIERSNILNWNEFRKSSTRS